MGKREADCSRLRTPVGELARKLALRPEPLAANVISRSGGGNNPAARSGHSIRLTLRSLKLSRKPARCGRGNAWKSNVISQ